MRFYNWIALALAYVAVEAQAESHTIKFNNKCGRGTPMLIKGSNVLSRGGDYKHDGPITSAIAYLQTGNCGFNGEGCTLIETTLINPTSPGSGSSSDISLIPPHKFSVASGFHYQNGCNGKGADCKTADCPKAFRKPNDTDKQVACQVNNVYLVITFCD